MLQLGVYLCQLAFKIVSLFDNGFKPVSDGDELTLQFDEFGNFALGVQTDLLVFHAQTMRLGEQLFNQVVAVVFAI
jgi:hypothetical protein